MRTSSVFSLGDMGCGLLSKDQRSNDRRHASRPRERRFLHRCCAEGIARIVRRLRLPGVYRQDGASLVHLDSKLQLAMQPCITATRSIVAVEEIRLVLLERWLGVELLGCQDLADEDRSYGAAGGDAGIASAT